MGRTQHRRAVVRQLEKAARPHLPDRVTRRGGQDRQSTDDASGPDGAAVRSGQTIPATRSAQFLERRPDRAAGGRLGFSFGSGARVAERRIGGGELLGSSSIEIGGQKSRQDSACASRYEQTVRCSKQRDRPGRFFRERHLRVNHGESGGGREMRARDQPLQLDFLRAGNDHDAVA